MKSTNSVLRVLCFILIVLLCLLSMDTLALASEIDNSSKIDPSLADILSITSNNQTIPISIWFNDIDQSLITKHTLELIESSIADNNSKNAFPKTISNKTAIHTTKSTLSTEQIQEITKSKRNLAKQIYTDYNYEQFNKVVGEINHYNIVYSCSFAPNIIIEINKTDLIKLEYNKNINKIYYYDKNAIMTDFAEENSDYSDINIDNCREFIDSPDWKTGLNINIGMIESGMPNIEIDTLKNSTNQLFRNPYAQDYYDTKHSSTVASVLIGKCEEEGKEFRGMVPDANLYYTSTATSNGGWKAAIEWLVSNGVNVINISTKLSTVNYSASNDVSRWVDHIVYQHNISVVAAVGYLNTSITGDDTNISPLVYSNNVIAVGAITLCVDENNNYYFTKYSSSAHSNAGRYYPHIVAPANPGWIPNYAPDPSQHLTGNSFSAPFVVGAIAQLMQTEPSLLLNPTLVKSIIMAGASGNRTSEDTDASGINIDRELGAGVVNVARSISCLSTSSIPKMFTGYYPSGNLDNINLSLYINKSGTVRLALNWQSRNEFYIGESHLGDSSTFSGYFSVIKLTIISPKGKTYTSFDVENPFQLLSFDVPNDDLGPYTITISRHGTSGYATPISLAVYGGEILS